MDNIDVYRRNTRAQLNSKSWFSMFQKLCRVLRCVSNGCEPVYSRGNSQIQCFHKIFKFPCKRSISEKSKFSSRKNNAVSISIRVGQSVRLFQRFKLEISSNRKILKRSVEQGLFFFLRFYQRFKTRNTDCQILRPSVEQWRSTTE